MKIGDLVKWVQPGQRDLNKDNITTGIVVDGPREGTRGESPAISYAVAWFQPEETLWHHDDNLELISENR